MRGRLRVAHVVQGMWMGGLERLVVRLCEASPPLGVEPVVITFAGGGPLEAPLRELGVPVLALDDAPGLSARLLRELSRALAAVKPDVVHAHDLAAWVNAVLARGVPLPRRSLPQVVVTLHETRAPAGALRLAAVACAEGTRAVVACSEAVRTVTTPWLPRGVPLQVIGNGVPLPIEDARKEAVGAARERLARAIGRDGPLPAGTWIGYLGRLEEEKGTDLLLEAFLQAFPAGDARGEGVHLVLIGPGHLEEKLRRRAGALVGRRVHFTGEVADGAALLPALDVRAVRWRCWRRWRRAFPRWGRSSRRSRRSTGTARRRCCFLPVTCVRWRRRCGRWRTPRRCGEVWARRHASVPGTSRWR